MIPNKILQDSRLLATAGHHSSYGGDSALCVCMSWHGGTGGRVDRSLSYRRGRGVSIHVNIFGPAPQRCLNTTINLILFNYQPPCFILQLGSRPARLCWLWGRLLRQQCRCTSRWKRIVQVCPTLPDALRKDKSIPDSIIHPTMLTYWGEGGGCAVLPRHWGWGEGGGGRRSSTSIDVGGWHQ
jgi:hypothetical protein